MADWKKTTIGGILSLEYGKPLAKELRKDDGMYPAYGANGVKAWTDEFYRDKKTIMVGRKGSAGEVNLTVEKFWPLDVTYFVEFNEEQYDLMFLYYLLKNKNLPSLARGVKPGINRNDVYALKVYVPDITEQKRKVEKLESSMLKFKRAKEITAEKLNLLEELEQSVMDRALSQGR